MQRLTPKLKGLRAAILEERITRQTRELYARRVGEIQRECGPLSGDPYSVLLTFLATNQGKYAASTLRGYKSAAMHYLRVEDKTLSEAENDDLDEVLQGLAAKKGPPEAKGPITQDRLNELVQWCHGQGQHLYADSFVVLSGICCRPRDIRELLASRVDLLRNTVTVRAKRSRVKIAELGAYETHEIGTEGARLILRRRLLGLSETQAVFPKWNDATARRLVKAAARQHGWPMTEMIFNGPHCLRHGAASQRFDEALSAAQQAGAWKSRTSTQRYAEPETSRRQRKKPRIEE